MNRLYLHRCRSMNQFSIMMGVSVRCLKKCSKIIFPFSFSITVTKTGSLTSLLNHLVRFFLDFVRLIYYWKLSVWFIACFLHILSQLKVKAYKVCLDFKWKDPKVCLRVNFFLKTQFKKNKTQNTFTDSIYKF